jgi:hypothetical protein
VSLHLSPFAAVSWSWRALRGHSVTFAAMFALSLLGFSAVAEFRHLLSRIGAPWYAWLLIPMLAIAYLARKESEWLPDAMSRRRWARGLFFGSIIIAVLIARLGSAKHPPVSPATGPIASERK